MDELIQRGMVRIRQRKQQIARLKAELAKHAVQNAREKTVNRAELMGSAWHRLQNALYVLALLEKMMLKLRKRQHASAQALRRPCNPCSSQPR